MGTITKRHQESIDGVVTECYVYAPADFITDKKVKRVKALRALWDTGASSTLVSSRIAKALDLTSIGDSFLSGYNSGIDVKRSKDNLFIPNPVRRGN